MRHFGTLQDVEQGGREEATIHCTPPPQPYPPHTHLHCMTDTFGDACDNCVDDVNVQVRALCVGLATHPMVIMMIAWL